MLPTCNAGSLKLMPGWILSLVVIQSTRTQISHRPTLAALHSGEVFDRAALGLLGEEGGVALILLAAVSTHDLYSYRRVEHTSTYEYS